MQHAYIHSLSTDLTELKLTKLVRRIVLSNEACKFHPNDHHKLIMCALFCIIPVDVDDCGTQANVSAIGPDHKIRQFLLLVVGFIKSVKCNTCVFIK